MPLNLIVYQKYTIYISYINIYNVCVYCLYHTDRANESSNILDNLLSRMEQYANNLESLGMYAFKTSIY